MFTLVGFYELDSHAALSGVTAIDDPHVRVSGDDIYIPELNKIMGVLAGGSGMTDCRLQSPSLRRLANQRISPFWDNTLPIERAAQAVDEGGAATYTITSRDIDHTPYYHDYRQNPRILDIAEALNAYIIDGNTSALNEWVMVWLMDKLEGVPNGTMFSVEATATATLVLGAWVNAALTFTQTLPAGRYAVTGLRVVNLDTVAARLLFTGLPWRPGVICSSIAAAPDVKLFRGGGLGNWGEFEHDSPPTIDLLGNAAGAETPDVILDLVQVRAGRKG